MSINIDYEYGVQTSPKPCSSVEQIPTVLVGAETFGNNYPVMDTAYPDDPSVGIMSFGVGSGGATVSTLCRFDLDTGEVAPLSYLGSMPLGVKYNPVTKQYITCRMGLPVSTTYPNGIGAYSVIDAGSFEITEKEVPSNINTRFGVFWNIEFSPDGLTCFLSGTGVMVLEATLLPSGKYDWNRVAVDAPMGVGNPRVGDADCAVCISEDGSQWMATVSREKLLYRYTYNKATKALTKTALDRSADWPDIYAAHRKSIVYDGTSKIMCDLGDTTFDAFSNIYLEDLNTGEKTIKRQQMGRLSNLNYSRLIKADTGVFYIGQSGRNYGTPGVYLLDWNGEIAGVTCSTIRRWGSRRPAGPGNTFLSGTPTINGNTFTFQRVNFL